MKKFNGKRIARNLVAGAFMLCAGVACNGNSPSDPHAKAQTKNKAKITQAHVAKSMKWAGFDNLKVKKNKDGSFIVGGYNQYGETAAFRVNENNVSMEATRQTNVGKTEISMQNICKRDPDFLPTGKPFVDDMDNLGAIVCQGERGKPTPEKKTEKADKTPTRSNAKTPILQSTGSLPTNAY